MVGNPRKVASSLSLSFWKMGLIRAAAAAAAKSLQSCPTLCDPIDGSPPGSPVTGILQARTLECLAISFSNAWKWKVKVKSLSRVWLFTTPCTAAYQAPPSVRFSRQEYWSGVPLHLALKVAGSIEFNNVYPGDKTMQGLHKGSPGGASGKEHMCQCKRHKRRRFDHWVEKTLWRKAWQPTPVFLSAQSPWT